MVWVLRKQPSYRSLVSHLPLHSSAYSRFKQLLESGGVLEAWYLFEANAVEAALRQWCEDNSIQLSPAQPEAWTCEDAWEASGMC